MKEFVGAEFLIAKMILAKNSAAISITELNKLGVNVRRLSINEGVNVVFLTSREEVYSAVWDYSDYFESSYDKDRIISFFSKSCSYFSSSSTLCSVNSDITSCLICFDMAATLSTVSCEMQVGVSSTSSVSSI